MAGRVFIDSAKVMAKGQVTIPKDVRDVLGVNNGDKVVFIVENDQVRIMNAAAFAMQLFQDQMRNEAQSKSFFSEEDIADWIRESREEVKQIMPNKKEKITCSDTSENKLSPSFWDRIMMREMEREPNFKEIREHTMELIKQEKLQKPNEENM